MTTLNFNYPGFKLGYRIDADSMALAYSGKEGQLDILHALKNLAHNEGLWQDVHPFGLNGKVLVK